MSVHQYVLVEAFGPSQSLSQFKTRLQEEGCLDDADIHVDEPTHLSCSATADNTPPMLLDEGLICDIPGLLVKVVLVKECVHEQTWLLAEGKRQYYAYIETVVGDDDELSLLVHRKAGDALAWAARARVFGAVAPLAEEPAAS